MVFLHWHAGVWTRAWMPFTHTRFNPFLPDVTLTLTLNPNPVSECGLYHAQQELNPSANVQYSGFTFSHVGGWGTTEKPVECTDCNTQKCAALCRGIMDCEAFEYGRYIRDVNAEDACRLLKWANINERGTDTDIQHQSYIRCKKGV